MGRSRALNILPLPRPHCYRPGAHSLKYTQDPDHVRELAADALLASISAAQGNKILPMDDLNPTYKPSPGRCLWNLADLLELEHPDPLDLTPFLGLALRPSSPTHPLISPRMAMHMAGLRMSETITLQQHLADRSIVAARPARHDAFVALRAMTYGPDIDPQVDTLRAHLMPGRHYPPPPRNSKRNKVQQYFLTRERECRPTHFGHQTMAEMALRWPPMDVEVGPHLHNLFEKACAHLRKQAHQARRQQPPDHLWAYLDDLEEVDFHLIEHLVLTHYLTGEWRFDDLYSDELSLSEYLIMALTRAMVQVKYTSALWRYQQPSLVMTLSIASGVSPAVFVRAAVEQVKRTGMSFLAETHPTALADMVRVLPKGPVATQHRRQSLIEELDELQNTMSRTLNALPPALAEETRLAMQSPSSFPAWGLGEGWDDD